jgi:hypothetical protein
MMRERFIRLQLPNNFNFLKNFNLQRTSPRPLPTGRGKYRPDLPNHDAAAGQAAVPEFHQLNVKAWLIRRIQIALITRYAVAFGPVSGF